LWGDEVAAWPNPLAWDMAMLGLRLGSLPQAVVTTTPKPKALVRRLVNDPRNVVTKGTTYDNAANLAPAFIQDIVAAYGGTALGRQELEADILDESPGALWKRSTFDRHRVRPDDGTVPLGQSVLPHLAQVVVAVDPAVSNVEGSDETGIVAFGATAAPWQARHGYVLGDASGRYSPDGWARAACSLADMVDADLIVAEANNGGDLVRAVLRTVDPHRKVVLVHASRGKRARAEPVAGLYEQGRIHHVGTWEVLEDQCCTWTPGETAESPDRLDALVWGATHTMLGTNRTMRTT
jgi:phage terminase large subunit-like protein